VNLARGIVACGISPPHRSTTVLLSQAMLDKFVLDLCKLGEVRLTFLMEGLVRLGWYRLG